MSNINHVFHIPLTGGPLLDRVTSFVVANAPQEIASSIVSPDNIRLLVEYCLDLLCYGSSEHEFAEQTPQETLSSLGLSEVDSRDLIDIIHRYLSSSLLAFDIEIVRQRGYSHDSEGFFSTTAYKLSPAMDGLFAVLYTTDPPTVDNDLCDTVPDAWSDY